MYIKKSIVFMLVAMVIVTLNSCSNSDDVGTAPVLPPLSSMVINFNDFNNAPSRSANEKSTTQSDINHWEYASVVVGIWNTALYTTVAIPVASFRTAFSHEAEYVGGTKWQWSYTVDGFTSQYTARLTGELAGSQVQWEMYITKSGIDSFDEFLWFSGVSQTDGKSGYWLLNHSAAFPEDMLRIDWTVEGEEIGNIKYTYVRELNNERNTDQFKDSYIIYGLQDAELDAFYDVHAYDFINKAFVDTNIEWNRTNYNGRVMSLNYFQDSEWHCWDTVGDNIICP